MAKKFAVISVENVGTNFGCCGVVKTRNHRTVAVTRTFPFGQRGNAYFAAVDMAADRGYAVEGREDDTAD